MFTRGYWWYDHLAVSNINLFKSPRPGQVQADIRRVRGVLEADSMAMKIPAMSHELDLFYMSLSDFTWLFLMILDLFQTEPRWQTRFCWGRSLAPKPRWWVLDSPGNKCPSKVCRARFSYMISMFIKVFFKKIFQETDLMFFQNCAEFFIGEIDWLIFWLFNDIILSLNMFQNMRSIINQQFDVYSGTYSDIIAVMAIYQL